MQRSPEGDQALLNWIDQIRLTQLRRAGVGAVVSKHWSATTIFRQLICKASVQQGHTASEKSECTAASGAKRSFGNRDNFELCARSVLLRFQLVQRQLVLEMRIGGAALRTPACRSKALGNSGLQRPELFSRCLKCSVWIHQTSLGFLEAKNYSALHENERKH